jgi:hypothetical protein
MMLKPANESQEQKAREIGGEKRAWQFAASFLLLFSPLSGRFVLERR